MGEQLIIQRFLNKNSPVEMRLVQYSRVDWNKTDKRARLNGQFDLLSQFLLYSLL